MYGWYYNNSRTTMTGRKYVEEAQSGLQNIAEYFTNKNHLVGNLKSNNVYFQLN
jgi:hypothetical protein